MMIRIFLVFCISFLFSTTVTAGPFYAEINAMLTRVDVDGTNFDLRLPKVKLGYIIVPQVMVELHYAGSDEKDNNNSILKVKSIQSVYIKLESKSEPDMRAAFILGASETDLEISGLSVVSDTFSGFSAGMVFSHIMWSKNDLFTVEFNRLYNNDDVKITTFSLGYLHEF